MPGAWEIPKSVLVGILHTETVTVAWSLGFRNLQIPGGIFPVSGAPFDMARNSICMKALEANVDFCFKKNVIVETIEGPKKIMDVQLGDVVKTHLGNWKRVTHLLKRELKQKSPMISVQTGNGSIKSTPEHPYYIYREGRGKRFVRACDIQYGDHLLYPNRYSNDYLNFDIKFNTIGTNGDGKKGSIKNGGRLGNVPVTKDIAEFLGLYLAEGCDSGSGTVFTFGNNESELVDLVRRVSKTLFDRDVSLIVRWATHCTINIRSLGKRLKEWFGDNARVKRIPEFVFNWNLENKLRFLYGYLKGDGCLRKDTVLWSFITASKQLSEDIVRLAKSIGMDFKVVEQIRNDSVFKDGKVAKGGLAFAGHSSKKGTEKFHDLLNAERDGDYLHIKVVGIENKKMCSHRNKEDQVVYNLEVEDDNSYIVDCAAVHNCLMLDSDVIPPHDAVLRLMNHDLPIVSGVYCRRSPPHGVPVMLKDGKWITQLPKDTLMEVDLVGAGMLLIRRDVLEKYQPLDPKRGKHWFDWRSDCTGIMPPGDCLSEDFAFCLGARRQGWRVMVDTSIQCRHVGYSEVTYGQIKPLETTPNT